MSSPEAIGRGFLKPGRACASHLVGGALMPLLMGKIADARHSIAPGYLDPLAAYIIVAVLPSPDPGHVTNGPGAISVLFS